MRRSRLQALFSHPEMVKRLLRSVVAEAFVDDLDFSTLRKTNHSFVTEQFRERESDIVWELEVRGEPIYIYILIEFQASVERFMALRVLTYILLFYADLLKARPKLTSLPVVFPIVLYHGAAAWSAPTLLEELIEARFAGLRAWVPRFQYYMRLSSTFQPVFSGRSR
ncbi:MAG: Rpn family recombination-promoting nuclease/putative transposase [Candidatus Xenobia bacterium]